MISVIRPPTPDVEDRMEPTEQSPKPCKTSWFGIVTMLRLFIRQRGRSTVEMALHEAKRRESTSDEAERDLSGLDLDDDRPTGD